MATSEGKPLAGLHPNLCLIGHGSCHKLLQLPPTHTKTGLFWPEDSIAGRRPQSEVTVMPSLAPLVVVVVFHFAGAEKCLLLLIHFLQGCLTELQIVSCPSFVSVSLNFH